MGGGLIEESGLIGGWVDGRLVWSEGGLTYGGGLIYDGGFEERVG